MRTRLLHRIDGLLERAGALHRLRSIDALGARARVTGAPVVVNRGHATIGDDFRFSSSPSCSHIVIEPGARLVIGDGVSIGSGACIACSRELHIGDGARIGRNVMILDTDYHEAGAMTSAGGSAPIVIEDGAHLEDDVIVLKGSTVGRGARVGAGSVVSGVVTPESFASGVPARVRSTHAAGDIAARVRDVVDREVTEDAVPDSLAMLRLLLAIEDAIGRALPDDALAGITSREQIMDAVLRAAT